MKKIVCLAILISLLTPVFVFSQNKSSDPGNPLGSYYLEILTIGEWKNMVNADKVYLVAGMMAGIDATLNYMRILINQEIDKNIVKNYEGMFKMLSVIGAINPIGVQDVVNKIDRGINLISDDTKVYKLILSYATMYYGRSINH